MMRLRMASGFDRCFNKLWRIHKGETTRIRYFSQFVQVIVRVNFIFTVAHHARKLLWRVFGEQISPVPICVAGSLVVNFQHSNFKKGMFMCIGFIAGDAHTPLNVID